MTNPLITDLINDYQIFYEDEDKLDIKEPEILSIMKGEYHITNVKPKTDEEKQKYGAELTEILSKFCTPFKRYVSEIKLKEKSLSMVD